MTGFSGALRSGTWSEHRRAEETDYLRALAAGEVDRAGYAEMVAQHYFAYLVLEEAAQVMRADPVAGPFVVEELTRVPALERDLTALLGPNWSTMVSPNAATRRYCERLRTVCFTWAGGFVAHHYTRYLGDLSGGQFLARVVERRLGLTPSTGTAFYDFSGLGDLTEFKQAYRDRLDAAPWSAEEQAHIIGEASVAYELNTAVLVELGQPGGTRVAQDVDGGAAA